MAAFGTGAGRPLQGRGGSPGFRFTLYAVLSVVVMYLDQRQHYLEGVRYVLQTAVYPIQLAVNSPPAAWRWLRESVQSREQLQAENGRLHARQRDLELLTMRYQALAQENAELRGLRSALPSVADRWLAAEIVNIQLSSLRQRLLLNRGASNGVFKGQAVLDDKGLIGQTVHVGLWSAEVILITDPEHAVPVRVERTGLRTIAVGAGDASSLALPYLPANADITTGDLLVTSGLGGVFPEGYPVARVTEVHRDAVQPLAQVRATPLSHVDTDTEVMLVWFRADHPAAPEPAARLGVDLKHGNPAMQPITAPPRESLAPPPAAAPRKDAQPVKSPAVAPQSRDATPPASQPKPQPATREPNSVPPPSQATPSQATPSQATPSQATPPQATPPQATPPQATPPQAASPQPTDAPPHLQGRA